MIRIIKFSVKNLRFHFIFDLSAYVFQLTFAHRQEFVTSTLNSSFVIIDIVNSIVNFALWAIYFESHQRIVEAYYLSKIGIFNPSPTKFYQALFPDAALAHGCFPRVFSLFISVQAGFHFESATPSQSAFCSSNLFHQIALTLFTSPNQHATGLV